MRFTVVLCAFIGLCCLTPHVLAASSDPSDTMFRDLIHHRSAVGLSGYLRAREKQEHLGLVCDAQLRHGRIPESCFPIAKAESKDWLSALCKTRVSGSRDLRELESSARSRALPEDCRKLASEKAGDLRYAEAAERPAALLQHELDSGSSGSAPESRGGLNLARTLNAPR